MIGPRAALAGLVALAFVSVGAAALKWRGDAIASTATLAAAEAELDTAIAANASLAAELDRARRQAEINDRVLLGLARELARIGGAIAATTEAIRDLETANEEVRAFLAAPVPGAVELQLNR